MQASLLCLTVLHYAFRANLSFRPSSQDLCEKKSQTVPEGLFTAALKQWPVQTLFKNLKLLNFAVNNLPPSLQISFLYIMCIRHRLRIGMWFTLQTLSTYYQHLLWWVIDCALKKLLPSSKYKKQKQVIIIQCQRLCFRKICSQGITNRMEYIS